LALVVQSCLLRQEVVAFVWLLVLVVAAVVAASPTCDAAPLPPKVSFSQLADVSRFQFLSLVWSAK